MRLLMLGQDPGNVEDLIVPAARILHVPQAGTTVRDIAEMPYRLGGRAAKPKAPLAFRGKGGNMTMIPGFGVTEAGELQDLAYAVHERQQAQQVDWREKFGLPSRDTLQERIREHMAEKARYFKAHAVTDPGEAKRDKRLY